MNIFDFIVHWREDDQKSESLTVRALLVSTTACDDVVWIFIWHFVNPKVHRKNVNVFYKPSSNSPITRFITWGLTSYTQHKLQLFIFWLGSCIWRAHSLKIVSMSKYNSVIVDSLESTWARERLMRLSCNNNF